MALLQIEDLTFCYPNAPENTLNHISFEIESGEFAVLCGASGCGKTTLLKLLKPSLSPFGEKSGRILYRGIDTETLDDRTAAAEIGFVLQNPEQQIVTDRVWHELSFGPENLGLSPEIIRRRVGEMASYFGMESWFRQSTDTLSGGQKQMLNLAAVMVMQPKILLLDEPTAQLDPIAAAEFIRTLQRLNRDFGLTVLLVEHRLEEIFPIADKVMILDDGLLSYCGKPSACADFFQAHPAHPIGAGLPAAMRIFNAVPVPGHPCPITVKDAKRLLEKSFRKEFTEISEPDTAAHEKPALTLKNVWFRYEKDLPDILRGISFSVFQGEHFCVLGGNGTGKTTLLQIMAALLRPYRGKVTVLGKEIGKRVDPAFYGREIALLPQNPQTVFCGKTVESDLWERCTGLPRDAAGARIAEVANCLQITHLLERHPFDLSGGEQQKAALAKLLLQKPVILLLDEPTKGLDPQAREELADILRGIGGITVITVTHDVEFAAENADRCALLFDGRLLSIEPPKAFFAGNRFYTTAANRIAGEHYPGAVRCSDVIALCRRNGMKPQTEREDSPHEEPA